MSNLVPIAAPNDLMFAQVYKANLESEGIKCFLENEKVASAHPFLNQAMGGVVIKVEEKNVTRAQEILDELNQQ